MDEELAGECNAELHASKARESLTGIIQNGHLILVSASTVRRFPESDSEMKEHSDRIALCHYGQCPPSAAEIIRAILKVLFVMEVELPPLLCSS
jgi:hypothetical protein